MFARVVTATLNPSRADEFRSTVTGQIESTLAAQPGFVELISLTSENDPNKVLAVTIWRSKQDAEKYASNTAPRVLAQVKPFVQDINIEHFSVDTGTGKRLSASTAA